jgi:hypothetical protein
VSVDPARFDRLWWIYVQRGAPVPFAPTFGVDCPAPDFERVRHPPPGQGARLHLPRKRTLATWAAGGAALSGLAALAVRSARRRRRPAPTPTDA